jgi:HEAT repeat protein
MSKKRLITNQNSVLRRAGRLVAPFLLVAGIMTIGGCATTNKKAAPVVEAKKTNKETTRILNGESKYTWALVENLTKRLKDEDPNVRKLAARSLGKFKVGYVIPALTEATKDKDSEVQKAAWEALKNHGENPKAVEGWIGALKDEDPKIRKFAAESLGSLKALDAIPALIKANNNDKDSKVRWAAWKALEICAQDPEAVPDLIEALNNENLGWGIKVLAARALGKFKAVEALPALIKSAKDKKERVRTVARKAVENILEKN